MLAVLSSSRCPQSLLFSSWVSEECGTQQCSYLSSFTIPLKANLCTMSKMPQLIGRVGQNLQDFFWLSLKANSLLCSSVNYFSFAWVHFVYLSSAQAVFLPIVKYDPTISGLMSLFCRLVDILATTAQSYGFLPHTTTSEDTFLPPPPTSPHATFLTYPNPPTTPQSVWMWSTYDNCLLLVH